MLAQVCDEVRGYIAAAGITLGSDGSIPSKLKNATLNIARYRIITRLPLDSFLTEARKQEYRDALALLEAVPAGRFLVEEPLNADPEQAGGSRPRFDEKPRYFSPDNQEGI